MALNGTNGDDFFLGTIFDDEVFGLRGDDVISASPGADTLDGGQDRDLVDYADFFLTRFGPIFTSDAVDVDLELAVQSGGMAEGDVLISIERISGSGLADFIRGDGEDNDLFGNGGDDFMEGRGGNDLMMGDASNGIFYGEDGNDHLDGGSGDDVLFGEIGDDTLIGGLDNDDLNGGDDNDTLFGDLGNDVLFGEDGVDRLIGGQGADELDGGDGIDTASYETSSAAVTVLLNGQTGAGSSGDAAGDFLFNIENLTGSVFNDLLSGSSAANVLSGNNGNDTLVGNGGNDTLNGGLGADTASYGTSSAGVSVNLGLGFGMGGNSGFDTLISIENANGSSFTDFLIGSATANVLNGGVGADALQGEAGNDIFIVDNAGDLVFENGGEGTDEVRTSVSYTLTANQDIETLRTTNDNGTAGINLAGNGSGNQIVGNNGDNVINGGAGADQLVGRGGDDFYIVDNGGDAITENGGQGIDEVRTSVSYVLTAGADVEVLATADDNGVAAINLTGNGSGNVVRGNNGANFISGAGGNDQLTGLGGQDTFAFNTTLNAATNVDVISDFSVADDTIQLENDVFVGLATSGLDATQFANGTAAQDATDRIIYDDTTGALFFDQDGVGGVAAVQFATLSAGLALTNLDFLVV